MTRGERMALAMGLIIGEGSFSGDTHTPALSVKLHEEDPEPLLFLKGFFGGKLYGPYDHDGRRYRVWRLTGPALLRQLPAIWKAMPPSRKRTQLAVWLDKWKLTSVADSAQREMMLTVEHSAKKRKVPRPSGVQLGLVS